MKKRPWYKSFEFYIVLCILAPPIGYIVVLTKKKQLKHDHWVGLLAVATITMAIWLIKFLPGRWGAIVYLTGSGIYVYHKLLNRFKKGNNKEDHKENS
ncbi:hypothetical protein C1N61_28585 (plasmid) [Priestia aryabhattai]